MVKVYEPGPGIEFRDVGSSYYVGDEKVERVEVAIAGVSNNQYVATDLFWHYGSPGDVFTIGEDGQPHWINPLEMVVNDGELRNQYPQLETAWRTLIAAVRDYELIKKMVKDPDQHG